VHFQPHQKAVGFCSRHISEYVNKSVIAEGLALIQSTYNHLRPSESRGFDSQTRFTAAHAHFTHCWAGLHIYISYGAGTQ